MISNQFKEIEEMILSGQFSGTILVKRDNEVVYEEAAGFADRMEKRANRKDTRYGIASGCKIFTAVAVAQLADEGLLSFDTKLKDCLDLEFPKWDADITIQQLLTHSSGIPDYFDEEVMDDFAQLWKETPMYLLQNPSDFLPMFRDKPMKSIPGERLHYNNAGYIILGLVVEQLARIPFTDYVNQNIFKRAGMSDSGYFSMDSLPENTAYGYEETEAGQFKTNIYSIPIKGGPDGGAYITAGDMVRFWEALLDNRLLSKETTNILLTPHIMVKEGVHYGFGIWINSNNESNLKYHVMGYDPGVSFHSAYYPETKVKTAVLSNFSSGAYSIMKAIEEHLYK
ncbi:class C beta-lactamase-related serine hydrolase [Bacillus salacetis]|uniref:Class C beta-lactamase-related serine hydrolase n=1 Tax=Bacillus salacetis TaxID=2315464 RepID=A0A3A1R6X5_9BACI|nr:serine hydrolase [Bacillus salacetis]RIW37261.1 class C beta-lactamase-related serine hydrolase [Bacillus salacetis]